MKSNGEHRRLEEKQKAGFGGLVMLILVSFPKIHKVALISVGSLFKFL